jgi:DNA-binding Lrp family transcriptional regulator
LIKALHRNGRAPFRAMADVIGVSEQTIARRYRRLRAHGALRVVGAINGPRVGQTSWTMRLRCTPDAATDIAQALARRPDTFWVHLLSGGTEISCNVQPRRNPDRDLLLLDKLPRTRQVVDISAHAVLHAYKVPGDLAPASAWLDSEHSGQLRSTCVPDLRHRSPTTDPVPLSDGDHALMKALARDGRAGYAELAAASGWSPSTVQRRVRDLRQLGVLVFLTSISPALLGHTVEARLWISVKPSALNKVGTEFARHPETSFVAATTGPTNLLAVVHCSGTEQLHRYLSEQVATLDSIHTVETAPVLRTLKGSGPAT